MDFNVALRNARADAIETQVGTTGTIHWFSAAKPANCAAADPAGELCGASLPADFLNAAANGVKTLNGTWAFTPTANGAALSFRIKDGSGTCVLQGTCGLTGSGADMELTNTALVNGQQFSVTTFTITEGNAGA